MWRTNDERKILPDTISTTIIRILPIIFLSSPPLNIALKSFGANLSQSSEWKLLSRWWSSSRDHDDGPIGAPVGSTAPADELTIIRDLGWNMLARGDKDSRAPFHSSCCWRTDMYADDDDSSIEYSAFSPHNFFIKCKYIEIDRFKL